MYGDLPCDRNLVGSPFLLPVVTHEQLSAQDQQWLAPTRDRSRKGRTGVESAISPAIRIVLGCSDLENGGLSWQQRRMEALRSTRRLEPNRFHWNCWKTLFSYGECRVYPCFHDVGRLMDRRSARRCTTFGLADRDAGTPRACAPPRVPIPSVSFSSRSQPDNKVCRSSNETDSKRERRFFHLDCSQFKY